MKTQYDVWQTEREKAEVLSCGLKVLKSNTVNGDPCLKVWMPKAMKPYFNYRLKTVEKQEQCLQECIKNFEEKKRIKAQWKAERIGTEDDLKKVKVGDIYVSSWGYDQTNIDYYQIVAIHGHMATIRKISLQDSLDVKPEKTADYVMPCPNRFIGKLMRKKIQFFKDKTSYFTIASYAIATPFNGKAHYQTNPAFGH